jgi:hypothetical protein
MGQRANVARGAETQRLNNNEREDKAIRDALRVLSDGAAARAPLPQDWKPPVVEQMQVYCAYRPDGDVERGIVVFLDNGEFWWGLPQFNAEDIWIRVDAPPFMLGPSALPAEVSARVSALPAEEPA